MYWYFSRRNKPINATRTVAGCSLFPFPQIKKKEKPVHWFMSVTDLLLLGRSPISKVIVGTGDISQGLKNGLSSVGFIVSSQILRHCQAPPADVHDPSVKDSRSPFKDEKGYARAKGQAIVVRGSSQGGRGGAHGATGVDFVRGGGKKGRAAWAHNAFQDYNGLYCDRIALGSPPERVAVLQPHTGLDRTGDALARVLDAHRHIDGCDVLMLYPTRRIPLGGAVLTTLRGTEQRGLIDPLTQGALISANEALVAASGREVKEEEEQEDQRECMSGEKGHAADVDPEAGLAMSVLSIGIGYTPLASSSRSPSSSSPFSQGHQHWSTVNIHAPIEPYALAALRNAVAPKLAYACAYWCANPAKAAQFLAKDFDNADIQRKEVNSTSPTTAFPALCPETLRTLRAAANGGALGTSSLQVDKTAESLVTSTSHLCNSTVSTSGSLSHLMQLYQSKTLQKPLLSTTDQRILYAYATGQAVCLKSTMNEVGTLNAASKIIDRLRAEGHWTVPNE